ncbi:MAG: hypothetical protein K0Q43_3452 [Ramlibacter sp.]|jgi:hypothetical protein|nr:hypothetical protein [Ramlibacter sp.]
MHPPVGPAWLVALELSGLGDAMRRSAWMYPIVEIFHIVGFVILVGAAVMFDLRVLGFGRGLSVTALARHLLPWSWAGLALVVPAGLMMFTAHATEFVTNPAFQLKLALLATAAANVAFFHLGPYRKVRAWDDAGDAPGTARAAAALSIGVWIAVIICGRLIAYF